jgi:4-hydroxy-tetrahydrodipicolinate synthase
MLGVKEATGSIERGQQVIAAARGRLAVLSGDDPTTLSLLVAGGQGVICTGSNVTPRRWVALWKAWKSGEIHRAANIQNELAPLHEALFCETNPGPVKGALHLIGLVHPEIHLPLTWPTPSTLSRLKEALGSLGVELAQENQ